MVHLQGVSGGVRLRGRWWDGGYQGLKEQGMGNYLIGIVFQFCKTIKFGTSVS